MPDRIDRLPCDQHGHDRSLAGAGSQLQGKAHQLRIRLIVGIVEMFEDFLTPASRVWRYFGKPDRCLDCFDLAKKRAYAAKLMVPPVLEQPSGSSGYLPLVRIGQVAPTVHLLANVGDESCVIVLLIR